MFFPYLKILKQRNFFLLWSGQIISQFGDRLTQMALIGLVYKYYPASNLAMAGVLSLGIIPVFLFSPIAGVYVDRWDKRKIMLLSDLLRALTIAFIPLTILLGGSFLLVCFFIFFSFSLARFFVPAKMSILPSLISGKEYFHANSLFSITGMIAAVLGFGLGGVIVEFLGVKVAFLIDAFTFFFSGLFIFFINLKTHPSNKNNSFSELIKEELTFIKNLLFKRIKEGIIYIFKNQETIFTSKIFFFLFAYLGSIYVTFIVFIQKTLSAPTAKLGFLAVGFGIGLFIGSVLYGHLGNKLKEEMAITISISLSSLYLIFFITLLKIHPSSWFAFLSCFILGILASPIFIASNTLIHRQSNDEYWGRIFSSFEIIIHLSFLIFMFLAAYLADKFSPFTIILFTSIIFFLFSLFDVTKLYLKKND